MRREAFAVVVDRPVEDVFAYVTDLARTPEWRTTVRRVEAPRWRGASPVGARFRAVTRVAGRRWDWVCEVTVWDPPWRFAYAVVDGVVPMEVGYRCEAYGHRCRFTLWAEVGGLDGLRRLVVPAVARGMRREVRAHVGNLQRLLAP